MKDHKTKFSMDDATILGMTAIVSIFLIVLIVISSGSVQSKAVSKDTSGQASDVLLNSADTGSCKLIIAQTTSYDNNVMAITLHQSEIAYYKGHMIKLIDVNDAGCVASVDGSSDYVALGQIQKIGLLYLTVKDISN
jgi:hypothetical protein